MMRIAVRGDICGLNNSCCSPGVVEVKWIIVYEGGVVAFPVLPVYESRALEDNLEVGEAVLATCSISCVCISAF